MFTRRPAGARLVPVLRKWQPPDSLPAPGQRVIDRGGVSGHRSTRIVASCECAGSRRGHRSQRGPAAVCVGPQIGPAVLAAAPGVGGLRDVQPERGRPVGPLAHGGQFVGRRGGLTWPVQLQSPPCGGGRDRHRQGDAVCSLPQLGDRQRNSGGRPSSPRPSSVQVSLSRCVPCTP